MLEIKFKEGETNKSSPWANIYFECKNALFYLVKGKAKRSGLNRI